MFVAARSDAPQGDRIAALLRASAEIEFGDDPRYSVDDSWSFLDDARSKKATRILRQGDAHLAQARAAYEALDLDTTLTLLNKALEAYKTQTAYVRDLRPIVRTLLLLGATYFLKGDETKANRYFRQAALIDPGFATDPTLLNQAMRDAFADEVAALAQRTQGSIDLQSGPSHAEIHLNGRLVGITPLQMDVLEGRYHVWVRKEGFTPWGEVMDVKAGNKLSRVIILQPNEPAQALSRVVDSAIAQLTREELSPTSAELTTLHEHVGSDHVFLLHTTVDTTRVEVVAQQLDLACRRALPRRTEVFGYDPRPDTYRKALRRLRADAPCTCPN